MKKMGCRLGDHCSVYQAEMVALHRAAAMAAEGGMETDIYSDSRSSLQAVGDPNTLNPLAVEVRSHIAAVEARGGVIALHWIKAHVGMAGNERADELAKNAALRSKLAPAYDKFPLSFAKHTIRQKTIQEWQDRYLSSETASVTRLFFKDVRALRKIIGEVGNRNTMAQLFTGHGGFRQYLHRFKLAETPYCACDDQREETVSHILTECPRFGPERWHCEQEMGADISEQNLGNLVNNRKTREIFIRFAESTIRKAGKANGSTIA